MDGFYGDGSFNCHSNFLLSVDTIVEIGYVVACCMAKE